MRENQVREFLGYVGGKGKGMITKIARSAMPIQFPFQDPKTPVTTEARNPRMIAANCDSLQSKLEEAGLEVKTEEIKCGVRVRVYRDSTDEEKVANEHAREDGDETPCPKLLVASGSDHDQHEALLMAVLGTMRQEAQEEEGRGKDGEETQEETAEPEEEAAPAPRKKRRA